MARSTKRASVALSLARFGCWEALWYERVCEENVWLERSVTSLASQRDTYLRELQKRHTSLQEVHKSLAPFKITRTFGNHTIHLSRGLEERNWAFESARGELEFLRGQNASLVQQLKEFASMNHEEFVEPLEN